MSKIRVASTMVVGLSLLVLSACGGQTSSSAGHDHPHETAAGDIQEKTASIEKLPSFLDKQREEIRIAYKVAAQSADFLQWMPCYCGCGDSAGHQSNKNCFIKEIESDGSVVWDDHGTRCGVCMQIAVTTYKLKEQGKTAKEIRQVIDETYKSGFAKPTPTPMPS